MKWIIKELHVWLRGSADNVDFFEGGKYYKTD